MNADAAFVTGKTHRVCQDYARAAQDGHYVIVADGCSSSEDSDFGSRLLVKTTELELDVEFNIHQSVMKAMEIASSLQLNKYCTDATLLLAEHKTIEGFDGVVVRAWGDGAVAARHVDGSLHIFNINYPSGYPTYPSYFLDPDRAKTLESSFGKNWPTIDRWQIIDGEKKLIDSVEAQSYPFKQQFASSEYAMVAVFSDGVSSFGDDKFRPVATTDIIIELMDIPAMKGQFVQRQINWMAKECAKRKWKHDDDVSMGAINLKE
jgi:hypothetical protein